MIFINIKHKHVLKFLLVCYIFVQGIMSGFATNSDPIPSEFRRIPKIELQPKGIPKWAYETPRHWDSTDIHPLRDLTMLFGSASCNDLEDKLKDGVPLDNVKMHDAVCDLKEALPATYKNQFKVLDVGFYTLAQAPYIQNKGQDMKEYLWDKQLSLYTTQYPAHPYRLIIAKQFKPDGKYADFRIGLKLPRATSGMFEKMNDAVEEAMQSILLKTIEDEYKRTSSVMAAETKGVEKLKELLGKISEVGMMSEEFLKLSGFEAISFGADATLTRNGNQQLDNLVKDYAGLQVLINGQNVYVRGNAIQAMQTNMTERPTMTLATIFTDNLNYTSNAGIDFQKANADFETMSRKIIIWFHWYSTGTAGQGKLYYKVKNKITTQEAEAFINNDWKARMVEYDKDPSLFKSPNSSGDRSAGCPVDSKWRTKKCLLPEVCSLTQGWDNSTYGVFDFGFYGGLYCGLADGILDTLGFFWDLGVGLNETLSHLPFTTEWFTDAYKKVVEQGSMWNGLMSKLDSDKNYWVEIKQSFDFFYNAFFTAEGRAKVKHDIAAELKNWFDGILGRQGTCHQGYYVGKLAFEVILTWATGGFGALRNVAKNIANFSKEAFNILKGGSFRELMYTAKTAGQKSLQYLKCKIGGKGCFVAGTQIAIGAGLTMPIQKLQLGDSVMSNNYVTSGYTARTENNKVIYQINADAQQPDLLTSDEQRQVDAITFKNNTWYRIDFEMKKFDGSLSKIKLLRPDWWIEQQHIKEENDVIHLSLPEMGLDGLATVTSIAHFKSSKNLDCEDPNTEYGAQIITGVFEHQSDDIWRISFDNNDTLGVTSIHPIYSLDRQQFIAAADLKINEQVLAQNKIIRVSSLSKSDALQPVYNLEVRGKHNFLVGNDGVVVHNSYWPDAKELAKLLETTVKDFHDNIKPVIKKQFKKEMDKIGSTNPDIGYDIDGNLLLKNPSNNKEINTGFPIGEFIKE